ncbi:hypothetical protein FKW77_005988 [Venturia effusa]|uniref:DUF6594 domain-containing protein n=1 Tax=Venturia effusa TaxID=50376 RepID=A0A517LFL4_9PEZI|nr:hypothetical protein FKW77_005988 [Venturia effusa]
MHGKIDMPRTAEKEISYVRVDDGRCVDYLMTGVGVGEEAGGKLGVNGRTGLRVGEGPESKIDDGDIGMSVAVQDDMYHVVCAALSLQLLLLDAQMAPSNLQSELTVIEERLDKLDEDARQTREPGIGLSTFRDWFYGRSLPGVTKPILVRASQKILEHEQDLLAIKSATDTDLVSQLLQDHWPFRGKLLNPSHSTAHFEEKHVTWAVAAITTMIAASLLIGSIATLSKVSSPGRRIAWIAGFTICFALSIAVLTNARRVEIFAATAAYVAVLVVFVSGNQVACIN